MGGLEAQAKPTPVIQGPRGVPLAAATRVMVDQAWAGLQVLSMVMLRSPWLSAPGAPVGESGKNGGGLIRLEVDQLVVNGGIYVDGQSGWAQGGASGGGAGGSINLRVRDISGTGAMSARGGNGATAEAGGGGGGRVAIRCRQVVSPVCC